jgi:hypothetical protein
VDQPSLRASISPARILQQSLRASVVFFAPLLRPQPTAATPNGSLGSRHISILLHRFGSLIFLASLFSDGSLSLHGSLAKRGSLVRHGSLFTPG